jgi:hypothetical protein
LDLAASLVAAGVESCIPDPVGDMLKDDRNATVADWGSGVVGKYVEAVRSMKRPLIGAEVYIPSKHRQLEQMVPTVVMALKQALWG